VIIETTQQTTKVARAVSKLNNPSTNGAAVEACTGNQWYAWRLIQKLITTSTPVQALTIATAGKLMRLGELVMAGTP
jgi:hypothetical protein